MDPQDIKLKDFLNTVCEYMRTWNSYADAFMLKHFSLDKICPEPYASFKKDVKLFYRALDPLYQNWFQNFFAQTNFEMDVVQALVKAHYFPLKTKSKNVFISFLYMCSFTYSLMLYCGKNGMVDMMNQLQTLLTEAFMSIKPRFLSEGGWEGLKRFCSSENLPTILQFISNCYCEKAIFHTYVCVSSSIISFGLHTKEILDLMMNNVQLFELSVRDAFEREIHVSINYKQEVDVSFLKLRSDLEKGISQACLSSDRDRLAKDPTSPLSRI